jgi:NAD+ synthase
MTILTDRIPAWIRDVVRESGAAGIVVEIDGALDSAVVGALVQRAVGDRATGLLLSCESDPDREEKARQAAHAVGLITARVPLESPFHALRARLPDGVDRARDGLKARFRAAVLFFYADHLNYLVAGSQDRNALLASGLTQCEGAGADLMPIGGLFQDEVRQLSRELGLPESLAGRGPETEAGTGGGVQGCPPEDLDRILLALDDGRSGVDPALRRQLRERVRRSARAWVGPRICDRTS